MDFSWVQFLTGAGQFALVAVLAFGFYCLLVSHLRFELLAEQAARGATPVEQSAQGAEAMLAARLAASSKPFLLVMMEATLRSAAELEAGPLAGIEKILRSQVRPQDRLTRVAGGTFICLVETVQAHAGSVLDRLTKVDVGVPDLLPLKGAVACYPEERGRAAELLALVRQRMQAGEQAKARDAASETIAHTDGQPPAQASRLLDPLTGVLRAEQVGASVQKYLARLRDAGQPFALVHVDVDYLRRYNDQYGEARGNRILKALSDFLQRRLREDDLIGRLSGGDEFVVALSADTDHALAVGRRLVTALRRSDKEGQLDGLRVSISAGVAVWPQHGASARHLLEAARRATRVAKGRGRGQCLMAEGPTPLTLADEEVKDLL